MPYKNRDDARAAEARYRANHPNRAKGDAAGQARRARARRHRAFAGTDGEGGNMPKPDTLFGTTHEYLLLRAGELTLKHQDGSPLTTSECLGFVADLPRNLEHVAYFFDYDSTMILRGLPPETIRKLFNGRTAMSPVRWKSFELRYLPHKELAVRRVHPDGSPVTSDYGVISDIGPFFQQSFLASLEDWQIGTAQQREKIRAGKLKRATFGNLEQETDDYNALECELLVELAETFADTCEDVGYMPKRWQGPGWLASAMLCAHGAVKNSDMPILRNESFRRLANAAYYGGRFETYMAGPVPGPVYEYDINSAYPAAMLKLPCMRHGTWVSTKNPMPGDLWFGEVEFTHAPNTRICHLPIRTKLGGLCFPRTGRGVYWSPELEAAARAGTDWKTAGTCYRYVNTRCDCRPFEWVADEYLKRKALGGLKGKVIKLALNSLYGKLAQSIGHPTYANPVHAALITSFTRAMLIDAYRARPEDVVMVATDAVYSRVPLKLDCGPGLGQWEAVTHDTGVFVVMPGVYFSEGESRSKTRGISQTVFDGYREQFREAFRSYYDGTGKPTVDVKVTQFVTLRQAASWGRFDDAGQWLESRRSVSMDWALKREPDRATRHPDGYLHTWPLEGGATSVPYAKRIGGWEEIREGQDGQPDWSQLFIPA